MSLYSFFAMEPFCDLHFAATELLTKYAVVNFPLTDSKTRKTQQYQKRVLQISSKWSTQGTQFNACEHGEGAPPLNAALKLHKNEN